MYLYMHICIESYINIYTEDREREREREILDFTVTTVCPDDLVALRRRARHDGQGASDATAGKRQQITLAGASLVPLAWRTGAAS